MGGRKHHGAWEALSRTFVVLIAWRLLSWEGPLSRPVLAALALASLYCGLLLLLAALGRKFKRPRLALADLFLSAFLAFASWPHWFPLVAFVGAAYETGWILNLPSGVGAVALALTGQAAAGFPYGILGPEWGAVALGTFLALGAGRLMGGLVQNLKARLNALQEISAAVASIPRLEEALRQIVLSSGLILEAEKCVILLRDENSGELVAQHPVLGLTEEEVQATKFKPQGLLKQVMESGEAVVAEAKSLSGHDALMANVLGAKSLICAPLQVENQTLGVIVVANRLGGGNFSDEDARLLGMLAAQAAMIIQNARLHAKVAEERSRLEAVMSSMPSGVLVLDHEGRIALANPLISKLLRRGPKEILGRSVEEVVDHPKLREILTRPIEGEETKAEVSFQPERDLVLEVRATEVKADDGRVLGRVAVLHDITELKRLDQMKSDFVSAVSHELRTPLTSIKAFTATLLRRQEFDARTQREFLEIIDNQCDRLTRLINDLLSVSRIEEGRALEMKWAWVDLREVVERVVKAQKPHARKHEFIVNIPPFLPPVAADEDKLEQILTNLVSNAVKYSPAGGPVEITVVERENEIEVSVADKGVGIPEDRLDRIFEKFYQVDSSTKRRVGGAGLGLYLTKHLVNAHGGRIWVKSKVGEGSTFYFTIPKRSELPKETKYQPKVEER